MSADPSAPVVAVLAGGRGQRLGGNKPTTLLAGRPLISYPLEAAAGAGLEAIVIAKPASSLPQLREPVVHDVDAMHHPLAGVVTALREHPAVIALGCDMPFVGGAMLRWFAGQRAATVVRRHGKFLQPFPALYLSRDLSSLERSMVSESSMRASIEQLEPQILDERELSAFGDPERLFFSVNTPGDLQLAESWLAAGQTAAAR